LFRRTQKKEPRTCRQGHPQESSWETCPFCTADDLPRERAGNGTETGTSSPALSSDPGRGAVVVPRKKRPAPSSALAGWLVAVSGEQEGDDFRVHLGKNVLGKGLQADIVVKDAYVSERHAVFESRDGECTIVDLGSKHGTFVNGQRIAEPSRVADGDRINLGHTELKYRSFE